MGLVFHRIVIRCTILMVGAQLMALTTLSAAGLPRSTPEAQGVNSAGIDRFLQAIEKSSVKLHSFMLVRHGQVVAECWWWPHVAQRLHPVYSLTKNFTAAAVGLAVAEKKLTLDDKVAFWLSDRLPAEVSPNLAAMRVRDLLTMTAGHAKDPLSSLAQSIRAGDAVRAVLARPVPYAPGTHFAYSNGAALLLSAVLQKATGQTMHEFLEPRLFAPLDITGEEWELYPEGLNPGGTGLQLKTEDIAKLGQLYLQKGNWKGIQLLPESWVKAATTTQVLNSHYGSNPDLMHGYGYMFWLAGHGAYRGYGSLDQNCLVVPDQDVVLVTTGENHDSPALFRMIWDMLRSAFQEMPLLPNAQADAQLQDRIRRAHSEESFPGGQSRPEMLPTQDQRDAQNEPRASENRCGPPSARVVQRL